MGTAAGWADIEQCFGIHLNSQNMVLQGLKGGSGAGNWINTLWLFVFWEFSDYIIQYSSLLFVTS